MPTDFDSEDAEKLGEIQDRYKTASQRLNKSLIEPGDADMRFVNGDTCPPSEREAREKAGRVWIDLDEINQYENQVINGIRANKRDVKFSPTGYGANDATARFYQQKAREIAYRSKAQIAYTNALQNAVWRGFGYIRFTLRWVDTMPDMRALQGDLPASLFHQDIWIEEIADPNTVLPDPDFKRSDLSDARYLFVLEQFTKEEFKRRWPKARMASFDRATMPADSAGWISDKSVQVAEYWRVKSEPVMTVALLEGPNGQPIVLPVEVLKAEGAPEGYEFKRERVVEEPKVTQCLTNGVEILEETQWPGRYLPFTGCFGKMLWMKSAKADGAERVVHSMTRLARPAATMMSYTATAQAELTRQVPKFPYFFYKGSLSPQSLEDLQRSYDEPVVGIALEHTVDGYTGQLLPPPIRAPFEPPIAALEAQKESYRRSIQAAMGTNFLPTDAQQKNNKSGKALDKIDASAQQGSFHFVDSFNLMVERGGVIEEDLMDRVLVGEREVSVIDDEQKSGSVWINTQRAGGIPSIAGRHAVTISVGPADADERQTASEFVDTVVSSPEILGMAQQPGSGPAKIVASAIRLKNMGPEGDKIADIYDPERDNEQGIPQEAQQMLMEGKQLLEAANARIQQLEQEKQADVIANTTRAAIAKNSDDTRLAIAELQAAQRAEAEELRAANDLRLQEMEDTIKRMEIALKAAQIETQRRHDHEMAETGHQHNLESQERSAEASERLASAPNGAPA